MKSIANIDFKGKRVLVRVDFNVPLNDDFQVTDSSRIEAAIPTIKEIISKGGKVILMSHLGRPKGTFNDSMTLNHVVSELSKCLGMKVQFVNDCIGAKVVNAVNSLSNGSVLLLENLRFYVEETDGDESFALKLSELGDIYVNDAFGTAHRAHASTAIIAKYFSADNKCFGLLMQKEIDCIDKVIKTPSKPSIAIVGGAKVSSKIDILKSLIYVMDSIIIGGGMAYTFIKAQGGHVGNSLVEDDKLDLARELLKLADEKGVKFILPVDSVNAAKFSNDAELETTNIKNVSDGFMGLDIGPKSIELFKRELSLGKTILWNGPLGVFEMESFSRGTQEIANTLVECTQQGCFTLVGGGDSVAAAKKFGVASKLTYISTGGGAMLESLEGKVLPGIQAILS